MRPLALSLLVRLVLVGAAVVGIGYLLVHTDRTTVGPDGCLAPSSATVGVIESASPISPPERRQGNAVDCATNRWFDGHHPGFLVGLARAGALVGTTIGALLVVAVVGTNVWGERGTLFPLSILAVAWGGAEIIARVAGEIVDRRPPPFMLEGLGTGGPAFPAHHVLVGTALLVAVAAVLVGDGWWRSHPIVTWTGASGAVALLAAGQLQLGSHWLTDVGVGLAAGVTWVVALLPPIAKVARGRVRREPFPMFRAAADAARRYTDSDR